MLQERKWQVCAQTWPKLTTVLSLYNTPRYNTDSDITQSCCSSHVFFTWNFTTELVENDHGIFL